MRRSTLASVVLAALFALPCFAQQPTPGFREVKVGDSFLLAQAKPVYASPQSEAPRALVVPTHVVPPVPPPMTDPYGFTLWLNAYRARNGRWPVAYNANLSAWAAANNAQQTFRGMGHYVMGPARRQNAGMGAGDTIWRMWAADPPHNAALLDPNITQIGIAASGPYWKQYWTFDAY